MRFFILEDDPDVLEVVTEQVRRIFRQADVMSFLTHKEMLIKLQNQTIPDCIICDVNMSDGHGIKLRESLLDAGAQIPFLFITGFDEDNLVEDEYTILAKPLSDERLKKEILKLLE